MGPLSLTTWDYDDLIYLTPDDIRDVMQQSTEISFLIFFFSLPREKLVLYLLRTSVMVIQVLIFSTGKYSSIFRHQYYLY